MAVPNAEHASNQEVWCNLAVVSRPRIEQLLEAAWDRRVTLVVADG